MMGTKFEKRRKKEAGDNYKVEMMVSLRFC